jgi:hypothetical protein
MNDSRIFQCLYCGKTLDLTMLSYKGYIPDQTKWSHYLVEGKKSCTKK